MLRISGLFGLAISVAAYASGDWLIATWLLLLSASNAFRGYTRPLPAARSGSR